MGPLGPAGLAVANQLLVARIGLLEGAREWNQEVAGGAGRVHWAPQQRLNPAVLFHRLRQGPELVEFATGLRENISATAGSVHATLQKQPNMADTRKSGIRPSG